MPGKAKPEEEEEDGIEKQAERLPEHTAKLKI
jgi:hypothetical protein